MVLNSNLVYSGMISRLCYNGETESRGLYWKSLIVPFVEVHEDSYSSIVLGLSTDNPSFTIVENTRFRRANNSKTTPREYLACALDIRKFQKQTRLYSCDIGVLRTEIEDSSNLPGVSKSTGAPPAQNEKVVRKAELEKILLRLLKGLNPEAFQVY